MTDSAERSETSCSPERPPKITPTLSFFDKIAPKNHEWDLLDLWDLLDSINPMSPTGPISPISPIHDSHKIFFPNADRISCTPSSAVRFDSSRTGLTSVSSNESILPESAIFSIARCRPAGNRGSDAGRVIRIDKIHIHGDMEAGRAPRGQPHRFVHHRAHSAFVEFAHRDHANARRFERYRLLGIDAARANQDAVFRMDFRSETADVGQVRRAVSEDGGERHSMNVAGRR